MKEKEAFQDNFNNILVCPNNGCMNIPDIIYTYDPLNPTVQYKCSSHNKESEEKMNLSLFLRNCSQNFICAFCQLELNYDNTNFYCKQCKNIIDFSCVNNHNYTFRQHEIFVINPNILYNNCLNHNNPYIFFFLNCNESLCYFCDLNHHNYEGHELKQLISISKNQNERDKICSDFDKQQNYLNKIKEKCNNLSKKIKNKEFNPNIPPIIITLPILPILQLRFIPTVFLKPKFNFTCSNEKNEYGAFLNLSVEAEVSLSMELGIYLPGINFPVELFVSVGLKGVLGAGKIGLKLEYNLNQNQLMFHLEYQLEALSLYFYIQFKFTINIQIHQFHFQFYLINQRLFGIYKEGHKEKIYKFLK